MSWNIAHIFHRIYNNMSCVPFGKYWMVIEFCRRFANDYMLSEYELSFRIDFLNIMLIFVNGNLRRVANENIP